MSATRLPCPLSISPASAYGPAELSKGYAMIMMMMVLFSVMQCETDRRLASERLEQFEYEWRKPTGFSHLLGRSATRFSLALSFLTCFLYVYQTWREKYFLSSGTELVVWWPPKLDSWRGWSKWNFFLPLSASRWAESESLRKELIKILDLDNSSPSK